MTDKNETLSQIEQHLSALDELFRDVTLDSKYVHALEAENAELRMENEQLKEQLHCAMRMIAHSSVDVPIVICDNEMDVRIGNSVADDLAQFHSFDSSDAKRRTRWLKIFSVMSTILMACNDKKDCDWWMERLPHAIIFEAWSEDGIQGMHKEGCDIRKWLKCGLELCRLSEIKS